MFSARLARDADRSSPRPAQLILAVTP